MSKKQLIRNNRHLLGTKPDMAIADELDVCQTSVTAVRNELGIKPYIQRIDHARVVKLYKSGKKYREIAAALGCSMAGVSLVLRKQRNVKRRIPSRIKR